MSEEKMNDVIIHSDVLDTMNSHMNNIDVKFDNLTREIENLNVTLHGTNKSILSIAEALATIDIALTTPSNTNPYYNSYPSSYYRPYQSDGSYMSYYDFYNKVLSSLSNISALLATIAGSINKEEVQLNSEQQPSQYNNSHGPFSDIKMSDYLSNIPLDPYVREAHERLEKSLVKQRQIDEMNKK